MKRILAIETSGEACSVALSVDGAVTEIHEHAPMRHAERLLPAIRLLLEEGGLAVRDLDVIAFGRGPGSFTSLRIGIGVVQGLAWGAGLPVVPVSSLAAVARQAWENAGQRQLPVCVAMDARMQEVFHANFSVSDTGVVAGLDEEKVSPPGLVAPAAKPFIAAGNGFERFEELHRLRDQATFSDPGLWPRAATVLALAREWLLSHEALPPALAQPVYIRNDVASKPKNH